MESEIDLRSESEHGETVENMETPSAGIMTFTITTILENLFIIGMNSIEAWGKAMDRLKSQSEVLSNPVMAQLFFTLQQMHNSFIQHVHVGIESQEKLPFAVAEEHSFENILEILTPIIEKKKFNDKIFPFDVVQDLMNIIRLVFQPKKVQKKSEPKNKRKSNPKRVTTKVKKSKKIIISSSSSSDSSGCDSGDEKDDFLKLFEKRKNHPITISQQFQYQQGDVRRKMSTPGETGSHLIKIEITDTNDLKKCKGEKFYWQKVLKKGYFLLNTNPKEDISISKNENDILTTVGQRVSKIENVKLESFTIDSKK